MSSRCLEALLSLLLLASPAAARELRVCADPNNLPFSNARGEGFENEIAALLARAIGAELKYTWFAQRRGFFRETLRARRCDVVIGVVAGHGMVATTRPYYRSGYVAVARRGLRVRSFDDPRLRALRVGVPLVGDDMANPPPAHALARRGIVDNVVGFTVYGDYRQPNPPARILDALEAGAIDVAFVWGPLGGWFAKTRPALEVTPLAGAEGDQRLTFDIAIGVRRGDDALRAELEAALRRHRREVARILARWGVPTR